MLPIHPLGMNITIKHNVKDYSVLENERLHLNVSLFNSHRINDEIHKLRASIEKQTNFINSYQSFEKTSCISRNEGCHKQMRNENPRKIFKSLILNKDGNQLGQRSSNKLNQQNNQEEIFKAGASVSLVDSNREWMNRQKRNISEFIHTTSTSKSLVTARIPPAIVRTSENEKHVDAIYKKIFDKQYRKLLEVEKLKYVASPRKLPSKLRKPNILSFQSSVSVTTFSKRNKMEKKKEKEKGKIVLRRDSDLHRYLKSDAANIKERIKKLKSKIFFIKGVYDYAFPPILNVKIKIMKGLTETQPQSNENIQTNLIEPPSSPGKNCGSNRKDKKRPNGSSQNNCEGNLMRDFVSPYSLFKFNVPSPKKIRSSLTSRSSSINPPSSMQQEPVLSVSKKLFYDK